MKKVFKNKKKAVFVITKSVFWFFIGVFLGLFFFASFAFIIFQKFYGDRVFPGATIENMPVGGKTQSDIATLYNGFNNKIKDSQLTFIYQNTVIATVAAEKIGIGYNENLLAKQAYSIGRSKDILSNISIVLQAYINGINLQPSYHYDDDALQKIIGPTIDKVTVLPTNAVFSFENGRVTTFRPSTEGQTIDRDAFLQTFSEKIPFIIQMQKPASFVFNLPIKILKPNVSTDQANNLGIKELIGEGTSLFQHSIPNRIDNVALAQSKFNGVLVAPNETFSFVKILGDVSAYTGYKQAYVIQNGHTVLGDGGGVCQVSTTLFRAILNAGLPIVERHAHDYRVGYYEEDSPPGLDATVFVPSVDLKFTNDTAHYILIQTQFDRENQRLTFFLYGANDGRQTTLSTPVVSNQTPAPAPLYQDDPTLPKGQVQQVDFAAAGAKVVFTRQVVRNGKAIINDTFVSDYRPWQAVYLRGTKD